MLFLQKHFFMRTKFIPMLVLMAWATSLSAQITREQADAIVLEHIQNEVYLKNFVISPHIKF